MTNSNDTNSNNNQQNSPFGNRRAPTPPDPNNNQQNQQQSSSSRFGSRFGSSNNNNNQQNNNQQNNNQQNSSSGSRFGGSSRFGSSRPSPFSDNSRSWTIQPLNKTVVRFELGGLGDPFARLLDYQLNPEYSNLRTLANVLEEKSEAVLELEGCLDSIWQGYGLEGAVMLYKWNQKAWKTISIPPVPEKQNNSDDSEDIQYEDDDNPAPQKPLFKCYRAIDVGLVLNVLLRARTQVMVAHAPLVFSSQYLTRSLMTDDPRLVDLVLATGFMEEAV